MHQCERDLIMDLIAPDGHDVQVMNRGLLRCSGVLQTFTSDNTLIGGAGFFGGAQAAGVWKLVVKDDGVGFTGTLDSWRLTISVHPTTSLPDLKITNIRPVQVVFGADIDRDDETDLVLGKSAAVLVTGHVDNSSALHSPVNINLQFEGVTYTRGFQPTDVDGSGNVQLNFSVLPTQLGMHQQVVATADPANLAPESDETNNTLTVPVSVRQTRALHIAYVEITDCVLPFIGPSCYGPLDVASASESFQQSRDFILATYPIPDIQAQRFARFMGSAIPVVGLTDDMNKAFRIGKRADPTIEKVVAIVPPDYFRYHLKSNVAGLSLPAENAVLASVDYWYTIDWPHSKRGRFWNGVRGKTPTTPRNCSACTTCSLKGTNLRLRIAMIHEQGSEEPHKQQRPPIGCRTECFPSC